MESLNRAATSTRTGRVTTGAPIKTDLSPT